MITFLGRCQRCRVAYLGRNFLSGCPVVLTRNLVILGGISWNLPAAGDLIYRERSPSLGLCPMARPSFFCSPLLKGFLRAPAKHMVVSRPRKGKCCQEYHSQHTSNCNTCTNKYTQTKVSRTNCFVCKGRGGGVLTKCQSQFLCYRKQPSLLSRSCR